MKCILIDDEPLAREGLAKMIAQIDSLELVSSFSNGIDANTYLQNHEINLLFLDIEMAGLNGVDFARSLHNKPLIVFITANPQYALESYEVDAIDFLVKPVRMELLMRAVNKADSYLKLLQNHFPKSEDVKVEKDSIFVKSEKRFLKIFLNEILYIEGLKDYVFIHTQEQKLLAAMNVKTIFNQLPSKQFARVSKSYIVNVDHITSLDANTIYIKDNEVPLGKEFKDDFIKNYVVNKIVKK
jgi:two-component system, LytTR family, response regulator